MTLDFRPGVVKPQDHLPPPPVKRDSQFMIFVKVFAIFLILRVAMIEMRVRIIDVPIIDDFIVWSMETIRFKLWEWGLIGTDQL